MIKISIKPDLDIERKIYFTTTKYEYVGNLIIFIDKFGKKQTWNTENIVNIEEGDLQ